MLKRGLHILSHQERPPLLKPFCITDHLTSENIFDPAVQWIDEPSQQESSYLLEEPTKKEQHDYHEELAKIKSDGCAPVKRALSLLMDSIQSRSGMKTSLSSCNVTLFNFHSTKFAERLIQRNINGLVLVENSHIFSMKAKQFAKQQKEAHNVNAYRADLASLLGIGRKKLLKLPKQLFPSGVEENNLCFVPASSDESGCRFEKSPIIVSVLPVASQQSAVLDALKKNVVLHHAGIDRDTLYRFGAVEFMTFLDVTHFSHLLCSIDSSLDFYTHSIRRNSALFHKFFQITLLRKQGFQRTSFHPPILKPLKRVSLPHAAKLEKLQLFPGLQYAVSIKPRTAFSLSGTFLNTTDQEGNFIGSDLLIPFDFWVQAIGKHSHNKKVEDIAKTMFPQSSTRVFEVVPKESKIGEVPDVLLEDMFLEAVDELRESNDYKKYLKILKVKREIDN